MIFILLFMMNAKADVSYDVDYEEAEVTHMDELYLTEDFEVVLDPYKDLRETEVIYENDSCEVQP